MGVFGGVEGYIINSTLAAWCYRCPVYELSQKGGRVEYVNTQSALELGSSHCPNGRLGEDLGFDGFAFALKLPELLNRNLAAVRAKLGQTSCFPNGPQIWCPIGQ